MTNSMTDTKTHFILVRHGQTEANEKDYVGGSTDDPLTETGHEQARKVGAFLRTKAADAVAVAGLGLALAVQRLAQAAPAAVSCRSGCSPSAIANSKLLSLHLCLSVTIPLPCKTLP